MSKSLDLYHEFRSKWPRDRVAKMALQEYSQTKKKSRGAIDTFTWWLEAKLQDYGSIWGGSSFKFGIYSRNEEGFREDKAGRRYTSDYAWYDKYGKTEDDAFKYVRGLILQVIDAAQRQDLDAIDEVDLGKVYKWKIAFHYQKDIANPDVLNIYDPVALRTIAGFGSSAKISECHRRLLQRRGSQPVLDYAEALWKEFQRGNVAEIVDNQENRKENLNTIYFGPPGTGKTWKVLQSVRQWDESASQEAESSPKKWLDPEAAFWHLAPGVGGYLWDQLRSGERLGYEWCSNRYGDLRTADIKNEHWSIIQRFAKIKKGDYLLVISGPRLLGIAQAKTDYLYENAVIPEFDFQTVEVDWITKFDLPVILNSTQTVTFCNIKGGARWQSVSTALAERGIIIGHKERSDETAGAEGMSRKTHMLVTFHQSYSYEDFIQGIKPVMDEENEDSGSPTLQYRIEPGVFLQACEYACQNAGYAGLQEALDDDRNTRKGRFAYAPPFYLIIDEINRGNVANIFGELITLIEPDKRLGNEYETILSLPYSKQRFGVPANLFIVGTMNTADRSVEALDSALRRRFSFVETYPEPQVIEQPEGFGVNIRLFLEALNGRVEQVLDRDHTIGHAYFTGIRNSEDPLEALAEVFRMKVVPQLQEYFYGTPERIFQVLGPDFVQETTSPYHLFGDTDLEASRWVISVPRTGTAAEREAAEKAFCRLYESVAS